MTYSRFLKEVSSAEFELWLGLHLLRQDECPYCGVEPRDMMEYGVEKVHCPVCKAEYHKTRRRSSHSSSARDHH